MEQTTHKPVLLDEAIKGLALKPEGIYVDGTFGRGGHAEKILSNLSAKGKLLAMDKDPQAIWVARELFGQDDRFYVKQGSFIELTSLAQQFDLVGKVDGILLDLGVSSPQLNDANRGFSFMKDGPLDMRMDPARGVSAADWLQTVKEDSLSGVLRDYGEEKFARRIARAIVKARAMAPITSTKRLAEIVAKANPAWEKKKHPATRAFLAIRLFINSELEELQNCLEQALEVLSIGGRLVVISFHSLEDRIVKRFMRKNELGDSMLKGLPLKQMEIKSRLKRIGKAIKPQAAELNLNHRARSAVLRIAEKRL